MSILLSTVGSIDNLRKDNLRHIASVAHEGKVVLVATITDDGVTAKLLYTVKQDGYEDSYLNTPVDQRTGWEKWVELPLPHEEDDPSVVAQENAELSYQASPTRLLMRSRYSSASLSALAPVQLVSALGHVYLFRQSTDGTLLVDRFVLDGMTNRLNPKLQVRYKRSRQKNQPLKTMRKGVQGMEDVDTLDFSDANNQPFFEPTTELLLIDNLVAGWFSVVLVPTTETDVRRWHVFSSNGQTGNVDVITLRASDEGLFTFRDYSVYDVSGGTPVSRPIAGVIRRSLALGNAGANLAATQGLAATSYDLQQEQATQSGEMQLVKTASRVMLAVPTTSGIATVSFAIASDGTLSELGVTPSFENIRSMRREVLMPLDTVDAIKAFADASPPPKGVVTGFGRSIDRRTEDLIEVRTAPGAAAELADGDPVALTGTRLFDGRHGVASVDGDRFDIDIDPSDGLGNWEKQEPERSGLVFDGMISSYELVDAGRLRITCPGHGLTPGDDVQIVGPEGFDGSYPVTRVDDRHFVINGRWANAEAINLNVVSRKRRGIVLDGVGDHVEIPAADALTVALNQDFCLEAWIKAQPQANEAPYKDILSKTRVVKSFGYSYAIRYLPDTRQFAAELYDGNTTTRIESSATIDDEGFHHLALVKARAQLSLYLDGKLERGGEASVDTSAGETRQITTTDGALYLGCRLSKNNFFKGQIADVRLWKSARSADDVRNRMCLPLTGMETSLVGCWRLSAVAEGKVIDASVNRNDGLVRGHAHVSATTLERTLANGLPVFKYSNPELIAVSQRSTYEESFEFRLDPPPADITGAEVFSFVHWGTASRSSDATRQAGDATQQNAVEVVADDPGWFRASARVTIPDGMAFLRSFEIKVQDVSPPSNWLSAEIRKHRIEWVSDAITESRVDAALPLTRLTDDPANARTAIARLAAEESRQAPLLIERRQLQDDIEGLASPEQANAALAKATLAAANAAAAYEAAKQALEAVIYDPVNYWCQIRSVSDPSKVWTHADVDGVAIVILMESQTDNSRLRQQWRFEKTGAATYVLGSRWDPEKRCANSPTVFGNIVRLVPSTAGEQWRISKSGSGYTIASAWANTFCVPTVAFASPFQLALLRDLGAAPDPADPWSHWTLEMVNGEATNPDIDTLTQDIERKAAQMKAANAERARLDGIAKNLQANQDKWTGRLKAVDAELAELQKVGGTLALANAACLAALNAPRAAMAMGVVANTGGLATQAGLLVSARAGSRVKALATCDGNVQLSYFDARGCMRLTRYDATSDSRNASAEQWQADGPRACLNFGSQDYVPVNINIATTPGWTIEAWFWFPLPDAEWKTLARGTQSHHVLVDKRGQLGIYRDGMFVDGGFEMNGLAPGWHHLAAVGAGENTLFYIDGKRVGDTRGSRDKAQAAAQLAVDTALKDQQLEALKRRPLKVVDSILALGNQQALGQSFGKIAELRVWGIALGDDEIASNAKTLLSGNEPGLLAYYPLDEGTGMQVGDRTGNSPAVGLKGTPIWWGCSAAIGNLGDADSKVMQFDGSGQCVEVPFAAELNPAQFTVACWARVTGGKNTWRSVLTSRNVGPARGYILYAGENNKWQCWVGNGGTAGWVVCSGTDAATDVVLNRWTHLAASFDGRQLKLYVDGLAVASVPGTHVINGPANGRPLRIGGGTTETSLVRYPFAGQIAELCLWNRALTPQEIAHTTNTRHRAGEAGLVACWPLSQPGGAAGPATDVVGGRNGQIKGATWGGDQLLPIVPDALLCEEYSTIGEGNVAMMRRFLGYTGKGAAMLLPEQRIELLELRWLGNAQFAPTLLGYIEGAPPVPSENLTMADDYNGAASVELNTSEDVEFKWTRTQDSGLGASIDAFLGGGGDMSIVAAPLGVGTEIETSTKVGFKGNLDFNYQFQNETSVASSSSLAMTDRLELRGTPESTPKFSHLGNRFIPKNVGYALVVSALADVFVTRLARSKRMIGYQVKPVEGMPPDVNTITFMMNPAYTMNGSLDGLTGSAATSERFFKQVPQLRAEFGSLYPASYYRLREAYDLKTQIEKADKDRESYFANFDVGMVDQLSLNRNIDQGAPPGPVTVKPDIPPTGNSTQPADQAGKDFAASADAGSKDTGDAAGKRQEEIKQRIDDLGKQTHAAVAFAGWQVKMEDLRIRAGKRNIVNNYVWDADGGLRSESQSFANTVEHSIGGSFTLNAALGAEAEFEAIVSVELTAQATVNMTQTMTKTETTSKGLELVVDLSGLEFRGITDYKDNPILPGEKVDRYRFMSFYLEGSDQNFQDFFNQVVDPEWLASNDEEARALRQARAGKSNKAWRVLHRVTYVERPALMGFGSVRRTVTAAETSDYQLLLDKLTQLEAAMKLLALKLP